MPKAFREQLKEKAEKEQAILAEEKETEEVAAAVQNEKYEQAKLTDENYLSKEAGPDVKVIGQVFNTYWITQYGDNLYYMDQHAAHEKVNYERFLKEFKTRSVHSQRIFPPKLITLTAPDKAAVLDHLDSFTEAGFELEDFGGNEIRLSALPVNLLGLSPTYFRGEEDIKEIRRILETAGYHINAIPGGGSAWDEIMELPQADLNLVFRDELALKAARELETEFGTPYLSVGMPYGIAGTLRWLDTINAALPAKNTEAIRQEAEAVNARLQFRSSNMQSLWGPLWFDNILIAAPPSEAAGIAEAVRGEWADTGNLVIHFTEDTPLRPKAANKICVTGKDDAAMKETFENWTGGLVIGSSLETSRFVRLKKPFVNCNIVLPSYHEIIATDSPLCGIRGASYLFERIWNAKLNSCMEEVK